MLAIMCYVNDTGRATETVSPGEVVAELSSLVVH